MLNKYFLDLSESSFLDGKVSRDARESLPSRKEKTLKGNTHI